MTQTTTYDRWCGHIYATERVERRQLVTYFEMVKRGEVNMVEIQVYAHTCDVRGGTKVPVRQSGDSQDEPSNQACTYFCL
jgi:hypothetical protein